MIDANWLNALKLPTKVISGLFLASIILLSLDGPEALDLSIFGGLAKPIVILICVVSGALTFTAAITFVIDLVGAKKRKILLRQRRSLRKAEQDEERANRKKQVLERLEHLSNEELSLLADCLKENSQTFTTWAHSPYAATLGSKGLIYTPGGTHHQDYYPFIVNDFVWKHLLENKDDIIAKDDENKRIEEQKKRNSRRRRY
ncbi:MAG: super-infection exclusion protein B [Candidatus Thiodiazotropha taylori]|nr:super-infection exclusion protein B [Candidatus Thiodiazotropha taylori]